MRSGSQSFDDRLKVNFSLEKTKNSAFSAFQCPVKVRTVLHRHTGVPRFRVRFGARDNVWNPNSIFLNRLLRTFFPSARLRGHAAERGAGDDAKPGWGPREPGKGGEGRPRGRPRHAREAQRQRPAALWSGVLLLLRVSAVRFVWTKARACGTNRAEQSAAACHGTEWNGTEFWQTEQSAAACHGVHVGPWDGRDAGHRIPHRLAAWDAKNARGARGGREAAGGGGRGEGSDERTVGLGVETAQVVTVTPESVFSKKGTTRTVSAQLRRPRPAPQALFATGVRGIVLLLLLVWWCACPVPSSPRLSSGVRGRVLVLLLCVVVRLSGPQLAALVLGCAHGDGCL